MYDYDAEIARMKKQMIERYSEMLDNVPNNRTLYELRDLMERVDRVIIKGGANHG